MPTLNLSRTLCVLALGAGFAAGCGDPAETVSYTTPVDGSEAASTPAATETPSPTETATPEPTETASPSPTPQQTPAKNVATLTIEADPTGQLLYTEEALETQAGANRIELINEAPVPHDVRFREGDEDIGGTDEITGDRTEAQLEFEPGTYQFYCSVPGHEQAGMVGTLTVR